VPELLATTPVIVPSPDGGVGAVVLVLQAAINTVKASNCVAALTESPGGYTAKLAVLAHLQITVMRLTKKAPDASRIGRLYSRRN
jgi:hypothetical protein